jgi:hypothetical protein
MTILQGVLPFFSSHNEKFNLGILAQVGLFLLFIDLKNFSPMG